MKYSFIVSAYKNKAYLQQIARDEKGYTLIFDDKQDCIDHMIEQYGLDYCQLVYLPERYGTIDTGIEFEE